MKILVGVAVMLLGGGCAAAADSLAARTLAAAEMGTATTMLAARAVFDPEESMTAMINGAPVVLRVGPGRSSTVQIRADDAARLFGPAARQFDRRGTWPGALRAAERIGPVLVRGHRALASIALAAGTVAAPVEWFGREDANVSSGQVGPFGIPAQVVQFRLRAAGPAERSFTVPLDEADNGWGIASTSLFLDGQRVRFAFAPQFATSIASAAAGGAIARAQGGRFTGAPVNVAINHGVARPARPVRLDRPLVIGPVTLPDLLVRTLDYGAPRGIADQEDSADNPADILVTARTDRQAPQYIVYLGADALTHCSSVTFDKVAMTISLACAFD